MSYDPHLGEMAIDSEQPTDTNDIVGHLHSIMGDYSEQAWEYSALRHAADLIEQQAEQITWWIAQTKANQDDYLKANERLAELEGQLPENMRERTIVFEECEKGHGLLCGTNWIKHECPYCRIAALEDKVKIHERDTTDFKIKERNKRRK